MPDEDPLRNDEQELENRLRSLVPSGHRLRRDKLMFQAGRRAAHRQTRSWQALAVVSLLGLVLLGWDGGKLSTRREPLALVQLEEPIQTDAMLPSTQATPRNSAWLPFSFPAIEYVRLRNQLVMDGGDALPIPPASAVGPDTIESIGDWYRETTSGSLRPGRFPALNPRKHGDPS
jgi:hypothetical protein